MNRWLQRQKKNNPPHHRYINQTYKRTDVAEAPVRVDRKKKKNKPPKEKASDVIRVHLLFAWKAKLIHYQHAKLNKNIKI